MTFEEYLDDSLNVFADNKIKESMKYCLEGGKRFRPNVMFSIVKGFGIPVEYAYPAACALEYIQTYSLIHDDLPGMDNDNIRRGKLSCHRQFGEDIAILTGDALLTHSFSCIADSDYTAEMKSNIISALAKYAGMGGMIYGQLLDVTKHSLNNEDELIEIHDNKTSGLFKFACLAAMFLANSNRYEYFETLGSKLGIAFQYQDDLFDVIKTEEESGKSNSDSRNKKITAISFRNIDDLKTHINELFIDLKAYLKDADFDTQYLNEIITKMENR